MSKRSFSLAVIGAALLSCALLGDEKAFAEKSPKDMIYLFGAGPNTSCGAFVRYLAEDPAMGRYELKGKRYGSESAVLMAWIQGFVSYQNIVEQKQITVDADGIAGWIKNFCEANPTTPMAGAALAFIGSQRGK